MEGSTGNIFMSEFRLPRGAILSMPAYSPKKRGFGRAQTVFCYLGFMQYIFLQAQNLCKLLRMVSATLYTFAETQVCTNRIFLGWSHFCCHKVDLISEPS